jgi:4-amino-4-deoxy-L-arabinose transferase-like glycosyltransferase
LTQINKLTLFLEKNPVYIRGFIILLILPALFINLGLYPFNLDEATRAIVALEMKFSGNYIIPTINGEFYYNKPPLFNWVQLFFVNASGSMGEFVFRLPVVISLLGFGTTIFFTLRRNLGPDVALLASLLLITSGRILFYDSFKGLIDITFSWIMYLNFWTLYNNFTKGRFSRLFLFSWLLVSVGFLLKGLPALVFQGISLVVLFTFHKSFKRLFSFWNVLGGLIFLTLIGGYLFLYQKGNSLSYYIANLWEESVKRTPIDNPFMATIRHFFAFPFNFMSYFLPGSLLVFCLFSGRVLKNIWSEKFLKYLIIIFFSNIIVYWISPAIYPRYLFMFLPSFFAVLAFAYTDVRTNLFIGKYILMPLSYVIPVVLLSGLIVYALIMNSPHHSGLLVKILILFFLALILSILYLRFESERIFILLGLVLFSRIAFNFLIFDERLHSGIDSYQKEEAIEVAEMTKGKPLYLYKDCPVHNSSTFYIERERQEILFRWKGEMEKGIFYIVPNHELGKLPEYKKQVEFETNLNFLKLSVIELK